MSKCVQLDQRLASAHERVFYNLGGEPLVAYLDFHLSVRFDLERHPSEGHGAAQGRRKRSAGDDSVSALGTNALMTAQHTLVEQQQANHMCALPARGQCVATDE